MIYKYNNVFLLKIIVVFWTLLTFDMASAFGDEWSIDKKQSQNALQIGKCDVAWDTLWKWAENGHPEAMGIISGALIGHGLIIPGAPTDGLSNIRLVLNFALHGSGWPKEGRLFLISLTRPFIDDKIESPFQKCLSSQSKFSHCAVIGVDEGILERKDRFLREIELYLTRSRKSATCTAPIIGK